ncbi:MAG: ABC transporter ATP-binding protein [Magnetococcales bacterium]|nr:ABC transporter ATP-binding protein [Magnetococcales bacterium]
MTTENLIRTEALGKTYSSPAGDFIALHGVDLQVARGEFVAIMGASGSGKSTFLNLLGCLDTPTRGHYFLQNRDMARLGPDGRSQARNHLIGFVFQGFNLLPRLTLAENVALPLVYRGTKRRDREQRAREELGKVGLETLADSYPNCISGGQQQRVAIARALVTEPSLILADEPTGNLDSRTSEEILTLFGGLHQKGITLILVTHEPDVARHAQRLIRFQDGRIIQDEPIGEARV